MLYNNEVRDLYAKVGLNYDSIKEIYPNDEEFKEIANFYFSDENFKLLGEYLEDEDYAMAKDAVKGLYVLAGELRLFPIYQALLEVYEDLESEMYDEVLKHYQEMINVYERIRGIFCD